MPDHVHWVIYPSPQDFERFAREEKEKGGKYADAPERFYLIPMPRSWRLS
jgi:hypothetical protein